MRRSLPLRFPLLILSILFVLLIAWSIFADIGVFGFFPAEPGRSGPSGLSAVREHRLVRSTRRGNVELEIARFRNESGIIWVLRDYGKTIPAPEYAEGIRPTESIVTGQWNETGDDLCFRVFPPEAMPGFSHYLAKDGKLILYYHSFNLHQSSALSVYDTDRMNLIYYSFDHGAITSPRIMEDRDGGILMMRRRRHGGNPESPLLEYHIQKYDRETNLVENVGVFSVPRAPVLSIDDAQLIDEDRQIALFAPPNTIYLVDIKNAEVSMKIESPPGMSITRGVISSDDKYAYTSGQTNEIGKFDMATGNLLARTFAFPTVGSLHGIWPTHLCLSPDGRWLAVGSIFSEDVFIFDAQELKAIKEINFNAKIKAISFSPDSSHLAVEAGGIVRIFKADF